jgi:hypothetical protein
MKRPVSYLSGVLAISFVVGICHGASPVLAKPQPKEWVKYLNPCHKKITPSTKIKIEQSKRKALKKLLLKVPKQSPTEKSVYLQQSVAKILTTPSWSPSSLTNKK